MDEVDIKVGKDEEIDLLADDDHDEGEGEARTHARLVCTRASDKKRKKNESKKRMRKKDFSDFLFAFLAVFFLPKKERYFEEQPRGKLFL